MSSPIKALDNLIDQISMYRWLLYYLLTLVAAAAILSFEKVLHYKASTILIQAAVAVFVCWLVNKIFAAIFNAATNYESSILSGLILALIIPPFTNTKGLLFVIAASSLAMASKYLLTIHAKHIFNPAAIAVVITAWLPKQSANWWVGTSALLPVIVIGGLIIVRKLRRYRMVLTFFVVTTIATIVAAHLTNNNLGTSLHDMVFSSAAFFLGFVMLTEPSSSPTTRLHQMIYAAIVGVLLTPQVHLGHVYSTPELALVIGNVYAFLVSPKTKLFPSLLSKIQIAANTMEFVLQPDRKPAYQPGQYMVWTLPHSKTDSRGNRRYFSLASSPTEEKIRLGVKFTPKGSSFKQALLKIEPDTLLAADSVGGDFVLPKDQTQKLAFIAGGIGITPYRSMLKYLMDRNEPRDIALLYGASRAADIAYKEVLELAQTKLKISLTYFISQPQATGPNVFRGRITKTKIAEIVPDYKDRLFYISGSQPFVKSCKTALKDLGLPARRIKTDYFSGYA